MDINNNENLIFKLSMLSEEQLSDLDVTFHLVRKQKEADNLFQTLEIQLALDVKKWVRESIIKSLNGLKQIDENNNNFFNVGDYNHEISINDKIAKFALNSTMLVKKEKLINSLRNSDSEFPETQTSFQIIKLTYEEKNAYFCYYRGIRKNTSKKKLVIKNSNQFQFISDTIIDIGGNFDFFILDGYIFILNVQNFEYAFDYRDHINSLRDQNLTTIISMSFFDDERSNKLIFEESCKKFFYSRGLAQIKPETLNAINENFKDRCEELSLIRSNVPEGSVEKTNYIKKYETIWNLFDFIDLEGYKIIFKESDSPKLLIHFFADKIVKSFLTEDFKVASAYE